MRMAYWWAGLLLTAISCSIKEDRRECPCVLQLDVSGCAGLPGETAISAWESKVHFCDILESPRSGKVEYEIPRGNLGVSVVSGCTVSRVNGEELKIPFRNNCDSIYAYTASISAHTDTVSCRPQLHKQFASVTLDMSAALDRKKDYTLTLISDMDGLDIRDLSPVYGEFRYILDREPEDIYHFRLLRQKDSILILSVCGEDGKATDIELGKIISSTGYDWNKEDLDDITVILEDLSLTMSITVKDWEIISL